MPGYVYLIGSHTFHWWKIGKSSDAKIRLPAIGILLPFKIEVAAVWKTEGPSVMENMLHQRCAANRINGEWFSFSEAEVDALVLDMAWAATDTLMDFSNLQEDFAPEGTVVKVKYTRRMPKAAWASAEERELRKLETIDWKSLKGIANHKEREARKREFIELAKKYREAQKQRAAKLLDTKTDSA
jgi:Meiotically Up-regulated Gene 113 (MUG113) protein